jgi:hypothetical protein
MAREMFHGSYEEGLEWITAGGRFGGVFASIDPVAEYYGCYIYLIQSPRELTNFELNNKIEGAREAALEIAGGDQSIATAIMKRDCRHEKAGNSESGWECDADFGWKLQKMRGQLAAKLGYTSVEMRDVHGTTWLCLPGCSIAHCYTCED